jgi:hypothetical protein
VRSQIAFQSGRGEGDGCDSLDHRSSCYYKGNRTECAARLDPLYALGSKDLRHPNLVVSTRWSTQCSRLNVRQPFSYCPWNAIEAFIAETEALHVAWFRRHISSPTKVIRNAHRHDTIRTEKGHCN